MTKAKRGFSLIETMVSMLIILTLLGMVSSLMREYSNVSRHSAARDSALDGAQFALTEMANELSSAIRLTAPLQGSDPDTTSPVLTFHKIDPSLKRFPEQNELETDGDGGVLMWRARDTSKWLLVDYRKDDATGALVRTATPTVGNPNRQVMVDKVNSLQVTTLASEHYQLSLSFQEEKRRLRTFTVQARKWIKA